MTPELGEPELELLCDWLTPEVQDEDAFHLGHPLRTGLQLDPALIPAGREQAAYAAELAAIHAPGQGVTVVPASNGTHVLGLALRALALHADRLGLRPHRPGSTIIVPALTWPGTATSALWHGYVPRIADVSPATLTLDPDAVEALVDETTVAITLVDLYARMADRDALVAIARRHRLALIEDAAHSIGAAWRGRAAGTWGHAGTGSTQGSKALTTGEGGFLVTTDRQLGEQLASLVNCGRLVGDALPLIADNNRLGGPAAAFGRAQLRRFSEQHALRTVTYAALDRVAADLPGVTPLAPQPAADRPPAYKWAFRTDLRAFAPLSLEQVGAALAADLAAEVARTYHPLSSAQLYQPATDPMLTQLPWWEGIEPSQYDTPHADNAYQSVLTLEHAVGLDPQIPAHFATAIRRIQRHAGALADRLAAEGIS